MLRGRAAADAACSRRPRWSSSAARSPRCSSASRCATLRPRAASRSARRSAPRRTPTRAIVVAVHAVRDPGAAQGAHVARSRHRQVPPTRSWRARSRWPSTASAAWTCRARSRSTAGPGRTPTRSGAQVLEAAAGYAPTLGILGAVLGLIHVMEQPRRARRKLGVGHRRRLRRDGLRRRLGEPDLPAARDQAARARPRGRAPARNRHRGRSRRCRATCTRGWSSSTSSAYVRDRAEQRRRRSGGGLTRHVRHRDPGGSRLARRATAGSSRTRTSSRCCSRSSRRCTRSRRSTRRSWRRSPTGCSRRSPASRPSPARPIGQGPAARRPRAHRRERRRRPRRDCARARRRHPRRPARDLEDTRGLVLSIPEAGTFPVGQRRPVAGRASRSSSAAGGGAGRSAATPSASKGTPTTCRFTRRGSRRTGSCPPRARRRRRRSSSSSRAGCRRTRLSAAGYGEFHPRVPNDSPAARARNRRVDIVMLDAGDPCRGGAGSKGPRP